MTREHGFGSSQLAFGRAGGATIVNRTLPGGVHLVSLWRSPWEARPKFNNQNFNTIRQEVRIDVLVSTDAQFGIAAVEGQV